MNRARHTRGGLSGVAWLGALLGLLGWLGAAPAAWAVETVTYYHFDALGSPVAASDAQGALLWREAYAPHGARLRNEHGGGERLGYTAKPEEAAFGLNYFGARWYDPAVGRFLGVDPVAFQDDNIHSFNRYAYVNNNPYRYVDPDGRAHVCGWGDGTGCGGSSLGGLTPFDAYLMMPAMGGGLSMSIGAPSARSIGATEQAVAKSGPKLLPPPKWSAKGFDPSKLERHFNKHKDGWGGNMPSASAYEARAKRLLNSEVGGDIKGFTSRDGWVFRYNSRTNEFATAKPDGTIETLFRPGRGTDYWKAQVQKYGP